MSVPIPFIHTSAVMLEIMFGDGLKFYNCNYSPDLVTGALSLSQNYNLENPIIFPVCCQIDIECFPQIENQILRIKESGSQYPEFRDRTITNDTSINDREIELRYILRDESKEKTFHMSAWPLI